MASADSIWERFVGCKLSQAPSFVSQSSENNSILGSRSINLTSGSIALHADARAATLMRDLAVTPATELLSGKASQELASRNRYVDFVRLVLSCCVADASGREKKAAVAVKALEASICVVDVRYYNSGQISWTDTGYGGLERQEHASTLFILSWHRSIGSNRQHFGWRSECCLPKELCVIRDLNV